MRTFTIIWFILYIGVWVWTIDRFIYGSQEWYDYLFPVLAMSIGIPNMIKEVLKFIKQKK